MKIGESLLEMNRLRSPRIRPSLTPRLAEKCAQREGLSQIPGECSRGQLIQDEKFDLASIIRKETHTMWGCHQTQGA